jgi:hypothetical protein
VVEMDGEFEPEEFERRFGIPKERHESILLERMRDEAIRVIRPDVPERSATTLRGTVVEVKLVGEGSDVAVVVLFRIAGRPDLCGTREAVWPAEDPTEEMSTPETIAMLVLSNVVEIFESTPPFALPSEADADGIVWWD